MSQQSSSPSISVLLPFHREGVWLLESAGSILNQTYPDWELILIGNRADQQTAEIAMALAASDKRVRLISEDRPGIANALNTGLEQARAPLVARMDADDYSMPERLDKQIAFLNKHPEIEVLGTCTMVHPDGPPGEGFAAFMDWQNSILTPEEHRLRRFIESPLAHPTVIFRKKAAETHGHYLTTGIPEDYELWLRWMDRGTVFAKLAEPLYKWRDHPERLTRSHSDYSKDRFQDVRTAYLATELKQILDGRSLIVCGADRLCRKKAESLIRMGVKVAGFTDVVQRRIPGYLFIPAAEIQAGSGFFFVSFVASRGKTTEMHDFLAGRGMTEGQDFILAS